MIINDDSIFFKWNCNLCCCCALGLRKTFSFCLFLKLHGRSREQRYTRLADWEYISECAKAAAPMPLFGKRILLYYFFSIF